MPRPLLTNVGLSKGVLGVQANKISNLGTNHHRQKQQQIYNELQNEGARGVSKRDCSLEIGKVQRSLASEMFTGTQPGEL